MELGRQPGPAARRAAILAGFVPIMIDPMMDAPDGDWGVPMYPVVEP